MDFISFNLKTHSSKQHFAQTCFPIFCSCSTPLIKFLPQPSAPYCSAETIFLRSIAPHDTSSLSVRHNRRPFVQRSIYLKPTWKSRLRLSIQQTKKVHIENFSRKENKTAPNKAKKKGGGISSVFPTSFHPLSKSGRRHFRWRIKFFLLLPHVERHFSDLIPFSLKHVSVFELLEERKPQPDWFNFPALPIWGTNHVLSKAVSISSFVEHTLAFASYSMYTNNRKNEYARPSPLSTHSIEHKGWKIYSHEKKEVANSKAVISWSIDCVTSAIGISLLEV